MAKASIDVVGMRRLVNGLESSLDTLDRIDQRLNALMLRVDLYPETARVVAARRWAEDELPSLRRRLSLAETLEGSRPEWLNGHVELDDEKDISSVDPATAAANGRAAAQALANGHGRPSQDVIDAILANQHDPYFAKAFAEQLDPGQLATLVTAWAGARVQPGQYTLDEANARNAWYGQAVQAISGTLGTATRGTGDQALPPGYAQGWVDAMTAVPPGLVDSGEHPDGRTDQANALSVLLSSGTFSTGFSTTVAGGLYDYERQWGAEHGKVWEPRSSDVAAGFSVTDANGGIVRDPMVGVMAMLGHNAEASQDFFSGGAQTTVTLDGRQVQVSERLRYLVVARTWGNDPGNGAALGAALRSATTQFRDLSDRGRVSADLAGQSLALIGAQSGTGKDWWHAGDPGWQMWDGMRPAVAAIVQSYSTDVYRTALDGDDDLTAGFAGQGSGDLFGTPVAYGARFDKDLLAKVLRTLGEDQENIKPVLAGLFQAGTVALDSGMDRAAAIQKANLQALVLAGKPVDGVASTVNNTSEVLGWALSNGFAGDSDDKARQAAQAAAIADALNLAAGLPCIPEIKNAWVAMAVDETKSRAIDSIRDSIDDDPAGAYDNLTDLTKTTLLQNTLDLMLRHGLWTPESIAAAQTQENITVTPPPEEAIVRDTQGRAVRFDTTSAAYKTWIGRAGYGALLEQSLVQPISDVWARPR